MIIPPPLRSGSTIAIVSPASAVNPDYIDGGAEALRLAGYNVMVMPHAKGSSGSFSGTKEQRAEDIIDALNDPTIDAVVCGRGGYGCVHLLDSLERNTSVADNPKWLVGFSDVSALHAFMQSKGVASIHGSMTKSLTQFPLDHPANASILRLLSGKPYQLDLPINPHNRHGEAEGRLAGGNLAVVQALISTPYDVFTSSPILLIEDIAEPIYKVERIMHQLKLSGVLSRISGLVVGQFTDYRPSRDYDTMEQMLMQFADDIHGPIAWGAPIGHIDINMAVMLGAKHRLTVTGNNAALSLLYPTEQDR